MRLYVGNLSYSTKEADLRRIFGTFGEVSSVALITDRETGRSKGFALCGVFQRRRRQSRDG